MLSVYGPSNLPSQLRDLWLLVSSARGLKETPTTYLHHLERYYNFYLDVYLSLRSLVSCLCGTKAWPGIFLLPLERYNS